jgi:hypothetical protein
MGPSEPPCGGRLQTTTCCGSGDVTVVSDCGKGVREASGGDQEDGAQSLTRTAVDASLLMRWHRNRVLLFGPGQVWRISAYWPGGARRGGDVSLICRSRAERGKTRPDAAACCAGLRKGALQAENP